MAYQPVPVGSMIYYTTTNSYFILTKYENGQIHFARFGAISSDRNGLTSDQYETIFSESFYESVGKLKKSHTKEYVIWRAE